MNLIFVIFKFGEASKRKAGIFHWKHSLFGAWINSEGDFDSREDKPRTGKVMKWVDTIITAAKLSLRNKAYCDSCFKTLAVVKPYCLVLPPDVNKSADDACISQTFTSITCQNNLVSD